jgi:hypothetical protein
MKRNCYLAPEIRDQPSLVEGTLLSVPELPLPELPPVLRFP